MEPLIAKIAEASNVAVLVLLLVNLGLVRLLTEVYRGMREDRTAQVEAMEKLTEVLTQVRLELAHNRQGDR